MTITTRRTWGLVFAACAAAAAAFVLALPLGFTVLEARFKWWTLGTPWAIVYDLAFGFLVVATIVRIRVGSEPDKTFLARRTLVAGIVGAVLFLATDSGLDLVGITLKLKNETEFFGWIYFPLTCMALLFAIYIGDSRLPASWGRFGIATLWTAFGTFVAYNGVGVVLLALMIGLKWDPGRDAFGWLLLWIWDWGLNYCVVAGIVAYCVGMADRMFRTPWFAMAERGRYCGDIEIGSEVALFTEKSGPRNRQPLGGIAVFKEGPDFVVQNGPGYPATVNGQSFNRYRLVDGDTLRFGDEVAVFCKPIDFLAGWPKKDRI